MDRRFKITAWVLFLVIFSAWVFISGNKVYTGNSIMIVTGYGICGNSSVDPDEACDDGNTVTETCGDGTVHDGSYCNADCSASLSLSEECDDGNTDNDDGCSSTCQDEAASPVCGNGVKETGDHCDDGNTASGDGWSSR